MSTLRPDRHYLEESLRADPDDLAGHSAYADLLVEEGDPRGEYIQFRLALEAGGLSVPERSRLEQQARRLRLDHERAWYGELAPFLLDPLGAEDDLVAEPEATCSLRYGWIDAIRVRCLSEAFARVLAHAPAARLLRELRIPRADHHSPREPHATALSRLAPLREATVLGNVRILELGDREAEFGYGWHADGTGVADVLGRLPRLEELHLLARPIDPRAVFTTPLPRLRVLRMDFADHFPLDAITANPTLTNLTHLLLDTRAAEVGVDEAPRPGFEVAALRALLASPRLAHLTHLRLRIPDLGDAGCAAVIESGIVGRLRLLDLRGCGLTGASGHRLADCRDVARLEKLDVNHNNIPAEAAARLRETGITVVADAQFGDAALVDADDLEA
jgi:uncharacterized protein (TIGR02996 family)